MLDDFDFDLVKKTSRVSLRTVVDTLKKTPITKHTIATESALENRLFEYLDKKYTIVKRQYNIGGHLGLKIDLDIGDGAVGIEAKVLGQYLKKTAEIHRLFGQLLYYSRRKYNNNNLIVVFAGAPGGDTSPVFQEVKEIIQELKVSVVYLSP
ncbi:MAG: hypothetical protein SFY70_06865 [Bacteroidia bacterium]|nr:hypothetical protein [Bacteroidia bacterium]